MRTQRKRLEMLLTFLIGIIWGVSLSQLLHRTSFFNSDSSLSSSTDGFTIGGLRCSESPNSMFDLQSQRPARSTTPTPFRLTTASGTLANVNASLGKSLAARLFNETRVLCIVLTSPKTHDTRAIHIKRTWGTRCNKLLFMSTKEDKELGAIGLQTKEGYSNLWGKMRESWRYVYQHHFKDFDWFLKADDDTYVVMENLRAFLYAYTPKAPVYFGSKFRVHVKQGYMSGGAGYVLSKAALQHFMQRSFNNASLCSKQTYGSEDIEIGRCLQHAGVVAGDSRDEQGLARFFPFSVLRSFDNPPTWYKPYLYYNLPKNKKDCCSNSAISFHYSNSMDYYVLDYVIYRLRAFGVAEAKEVLPKKRKVLEILQKWRKTKSNNIK